ncbi:hypothetical protein, partial [Hafnia paralvei]|uniref:hypothetical protein n=1 Tax=Hafnia paralvei TaxID=546367 RepID=UPI0015CBF1C4
MTRNSKFWLAVAVVFDALGLFISFFGVMIVGAGVSGSGCGQQCSANSEMFIAIGIGLAPIFPYTFYHLTHDWFVAADIPVANDTPVHYADAIRCNVR